MRPRLENRMSCAAAAIAISAMVACGPAVDAKAPQGGAAAGSGAGAAPVPSSQKLSASPPTPTEAECRERASKPALMPSRVESDVKLQYDAFFLAQHETFRCCFDALYAPNKPRTDGQVALLVKVDASGKLASSEVITGETTAQAPGMNACVVEMARALTYPKPANSMAIGYKRTFQFKARR